MPITLLSLSLGGILGTVFGIVFGLALFLLLISFVVFLVLFARPKSVYKPNAITYKMMGPDLDNLNKFNAENLEELKKRECEDIKVTSDDGLTFSGYLYRADQPTDKAVLLSHGFKSTTYNTYPAIARFYLSQGFDVYMINHRAHEKSEGDYSGFGQFEGNDLLKWLELMVKNNPNYKIVMHGNSMGAASVMECSALNIPSNVKCCIADCGYTSSKKELEYQMINMFHVPPHPILDIIAVFCKSVAKFDLDGVSALESVKSSKVPMMFVHGTTDATVPISMAHELYEACGNEKKLSIFEGAGHGQSYFKHTEEYQKEIIDFTSKYLDKE